MIVSLSLIVVRLFAVFFFMKALTFLPVTVSTFYGSAQEPSVRLDLLVLALNLFICVLLFCYPRTVLVGLSLPKSEARMETGALQLFQAAAIAVIGFYFAMQGLQDLVYYHLFLWKMGTYQLGGQPLSPQDTASYWTAVVQTGLGAGLIVFSVGFSRLFNWLRKLSPVPDRETPQE